MSNNKLTVDLKACVDGQNRTYYVGFLEAPATIDLRDGVAFLIFTSEAGYEQLQIGALHKNKEGKRDGNRRENRNSYREEPEVYVQNRVKAENE